MTISTGVISWYYKFNTKASIGKREGYLIVVFGWLFMVSFGMLPYILSGEVQGVTDAFFETVSGMTTTGASILTDIESVPKGILFWRSLTQWIGGMGIIVLTVAIFPLLGIGGVELFVAEAPGPSSDKLHPRIKETAKRLWYIYFGLTVVLFFLLFFEGMSLYDAANHALTTMATGGFSTKNASMAHFDIPIIQYTITLFMFIAGVNYTVIYYGLNGKLKKAWASTEFKTYVLIILLLAFFLTIGIYYNGDASLEKSFRDGIFQIVSLITTTGFVSADYTQWGTAITFVFFILLFIGASAGSTAGGIKIIRHVVFLKNSFLEFKRLIHPRAVIPIKIDKHVVKPKIVRHVLVFLLLYLIIFVVSSFILTALGLDFLTAIGATATSFGNVGPGIGDVGPVDNFAGLPSTVKWYLSGLMIVGRLEIFSVFILFSPYFWKQNYH